MKRWIWLLGVMVLASVAGVLVQWPIDYFGVVREGTDTFAGHEAIYGDQVISFPFVYKDELRGVGLILVDLRRSEQLTPVVVSVFRDGSMVHRDVIAPMELIDDAFAWARFSDGLLANTVYEVRVAAPDATEETAIGMRFDVEENKPALGVLRRVNVWQYALLWGEAHPERWRYLWRFVVGGLLLSGLLWVGGTGKRLLGFDVFWWLLVLIGVLVFMSRLYFVGRIESAFGGDAFNYLWQSRAWLEGDNPFAVEFRRKAPLYPLLLLPGFLPWLDALTWSRVVNILVAVASVVVLVLFLRRLKIGKSLALGGGLLLAVQQLFWFESMNALGNPLYLLMVLLAAYAFTFYQRKHGRYWVGVLVGLATLSRWEGGLVAAVLVPAVWMLDRWRWRTLVYVGLPAVILLAIPFLMWPLTGEIGIRPLSDLQADGGLGLIESVDDFLVNWKAFTLTWGRMWIFTPLVGDQWFWFVVGGLVGIMVGLVERYRERWLSWLAGLVLLVPIGLLWLLIRDDVELNRFVVMLFTFLTSMGLGALSVQKAKIALPLYLMLLGQALLITAILPKPRYYLTLLPFAVVGLVVVVGIMGKSRWLARGDAIVMGCLVAFVVVQSLGHLPGGISDFNTKSQYQTVDLAAARYLQHVSGQVAMVGGGVIMLAYLDGGRTSLIDPGQFEGMDATAQWEFLQAVDARYLVESNEWGDWSVVRDRPESFVLTHESGTRFGAAVSKVYRIIDQ